LSKKNFKARFLSDLLPILSDVSSPALFFLPTALWQRFFVAVFVYEILAGNFFKKIKNLSFTINFNFK